jgi:RND family efflux transporter MFP subunit
MAGFHRGLALLGMAILLLTPRLHAAEHKTLYTCGMHPQIIQDHPGDCPICGMRLTPIRSTEATADTEVINAPAADGDAIVIDPATIQTMGVRTALVTGGPLRRTIRTVGNVAYDETSLAQVTTKFQGWVEKLHVDATGALVNPGDPLFEIDSPDVYSAETEFLAALPGTNDNRSAESRRGQWDGARAKLKFYDLTDVQIAALEASRTPARLITVHARQSGFVTEKDVVPGQMVEPGMKLYELADLAIVWVYAEIYEQDLPCVQLGQEATMTLSYLPDRTFRGRVTYVYPTVDEKTRTARVRMEFHNPGYFLKPGMFATVELVSEVSPNAVQVPDSAVLRSGRQNTVFVALPGGRFAPRTVVLGMQAQDDLDEVLSGLAAGERVVTSGQFLLDSESQLREAIQKMTSGGGTGESEPPANTSAASATNAPENPMPVAAAPDKLVWVCPMPEHVSIEYDHPGKCPICGMTLVPVGQAELKKTQPGGQVLYYTCPMPEHHVHADKPGKCPVCGMTLIPVMSLPGTTNAVTGEK